MTSFQFLVTFHICEQGRRNILGMLGPVFTKFLKNFNYYLFHSLELLQNMPILKKQHEFCPHQGFSHSDGPFKFWISVIQSHLTTDQKQALNRYFISLSNCFLWQIFRKRKCFKNQSPYFETSLTGFISYIHMWKLVTERNFFENQNFAIFSAAYLKIRIRSIFDQ